MPRLGKRFAVPERPRETHRADRLLRRAARRPGGAAHRNRDLGVTVDQRARHHLLHRLFRHRAVLFQRFHFDAEHFALGNIGIGDEAALVPIGAARHHGHRLADPSAGARFSGNQHQRARFQRPTDLLGQSVKSGIRQINSHFNVPVLIPAGVTRISVRTQPGQAQCKPPPARRRTSRRNRS